MVTGMAGLGASPASAADMRNAALPVPGRWSSPALGGGGGVIGLGIAGAGPQQGLCRQALAALGAATVQHQTAALGGHAGAETVAARTNEVRGLKSALHGRLRFSRLRAARDDRVRGRGNATTPSAWRRVNEGRWIGQPAAQVNTPSGMRQQPLCRRSVCTIFGVSPRNSSAWGRPAVPTAGIGIPRRAADARRDAEMPQRRALAGTAHTSHLFDRRVVCDLHPPDDMAFALSGPGARPGT